MCGVILRANRKRASHLLFEPNDTNYTVANDVDILVREVTKERNAVRFFHELIAEMSSPRWQICTRRKSAGDRDAYEEAGNEEKRRNH